MKQLHLSKLCAPTNFLKKKDNNKDNILLISVQHNKTYTQNMKKMYYVAWQLMSPDTIIKASRAG